MAFCWTRFDFALPFSWTRFCAEDCPPECGPGDHTIPGPCSEWEYAPYGPSTPSPSTSTTSSGGFVAAVVIGVVAILVLLLLLFCWCRRRQRDTNVREDLDARGRVLIGSK
jgi:hypothetical protein